MKTSATGREHKLSPTIERMVIVVATILAVIMIIRMIEHKPDFAIVVAIFVLIAGFIIWLNRLRPTLKAHYHQYTCHQCSWEGDEDKVTRWIDNTPECPMCGSYIKHNRVKGER